MSFRSIERHRDGSLILLDQRKLPGEETYLTCKSWEEVADAIRNMTVRGAPAIGVTAAHGLAMAGHQLADQTQDIQTLLDSLSHVLDTFSKTRPTALNLFGALARMQAVMDRQKNTNIETLVTQLDQEAKAIHQEDVVTCDLIAKNGNPLIPMGARVLTHCNTGGLATAGVGTALGVIRAASESGKKVHVWADETRPWLQGARLTTWECKSLGIPCTLIPDTVGTDLMRRKQVDLVLVGADRIARNGDTANKIGTYNLAVAAHHHGIPLYVVAPLTTIDRTMKSGREIPIEERNPQEVTMIGEQAIAPEGTHVHNPSFDITPAELIRGIVTEAGIARPPYGESVQNLFCVRPVTSGTKTSS